ncbi:MAG: hypothetical protein HOP31_08910 [Ignavibacteria bacterium]|nr:hypothetical protein [Ignavibacteria bacterium]
MKEIIIEVPKSAKFVVDGDKVKVIFHSEYTNKLFLKLRVGGKQVDSKEIIASKKNKIHLQV